MSRPFITLTNVQLEVLKGLNDAEIEWRILDDATASHGPTNGYEANNNLVLVHVKPLCDNHPTDCYIMAENSHLWVYDQDRDSYDIVTVSIDTGIRRV